MIERVNPYEESHGWFDGGEVPMEGICQSLMVCHMQKIIIVYRHKVRTCASRKRGDVHAIEVGDEIANCLTSVSTDSMVFYE